MDLKFEHSKPIRATLKDMEVGDLVEFPTSKTSVIRSTSSTLGLELGRRYTARLNRRTMTINVIRIS